MVCGPMHMPPWAPARPRQGAGRRGGSRPSQLAVPSRSCLGRLGAPRACCWLVSAHPAQRSLQQERRIRPPPG